MPIRLHFLEQRKDVLGLGNEQRLESVLRGKVVLAAVDERPDEVLVMHDADDVVSVLVKDGKARVARAVHALDRRAHRLGVLDHDHVDARLHDFMHRHVAQVDDVVDHALLVVGELIVVGDDVFDFLLGDRLLLRRPET